MKRRSLYRGTSDKLTYSCLYQLDIALCSNIVTGWGKIEERRVFVTADDFSVRGGHSDGGVAGKVAYGEVRSYVSSNVFSRVSAILIANFHLGFSSQSTSPPRKLSYECSYRCLPLNFPSRFVY